MPKTIADPAALQAMVIRVRALQPDSRPIWGKMNAHQAIVHMTDQFRMALGEITTRDVSNFFTRVIAKKLILWGMPAPKGKIDTLPELDALKMGTAPQDFESDSNLLIAKMNRLAQPNTPVFPHGGFGPLSHSQWCRLAWLHLHHHLTQFGV